MRKTISPVAIGLAVATVLVLAFAVLIASSMIAGTVEQAQTSPSVSAEPDDEAVPPELEDPALQRYKDKVTTMIIEFETLRWSRQWNKQEERYKALRKQMNARTFALLKDEDDSPVYDRLMNKTAKASFTVTNVVPVEGEIEEPTNEGYSFADMTVRMSVRQVHQEDGVEKTTDHTFESSTSWMLQNGKWLVYDFGVG